MKFSSVAHQIMWARKCFGSLLVINYFANYWLDYVFNGFYITRKNNQMFNIFCRFYTHRNKYHKFVSKWVASVFLWRHQNVACCSTYMYIAWAYIPILIIWYFEYITVVRILSDNKTPSKISASELQGLCENDPFYNSQWDTVRVWWRKIKCSWMHLEWILEMH